MNCPLNSFTGQNMVPSKSTWIIFLPCLIAVVTATRLHYLSKSENNQTMPFDFSRDRTCHWIKHGAREPGDVSLALAQIDDLRRVSDCYRLDLDDEKSRITYVRCGYRSMDEDASLTVAEGGQGHNYLVLVYSSESKKFYACCLIYGLESNK